jgi:hypothetical protein
MQSHHGVVLYCGCCVVRFHSDNTPHYKNVLRTGREKRLTKLVVLVVVLGTLEGEVGSKVVRICRYGACQKKKHGFTSL